MLADSPILIVEDDAFQRLALRNMLNKIGVAQMTEAANGKEALLSIKEQPPHLILMDLDMPEMDGREALRYVRKHYPQIRVIILTASESQQDILQCMQAGATDFLTKPPTPARLRVSIENALQQRALTDHVALLERKQKGQLRFRDLIGFDGGLSEAVLLGKRAATSEIPVLISGETGTGKEWFAQAIHGESVRADHPFVAVNCGAIPENLVESYLFGHVKGAFTGAVADTLGKFREANGGTIFLDEIGELPLNAQVKLLRVLQEGEVEPVGAGSRYPINVRVISATHKHLPQAVKQGEFREDLFFRLNGLPITLPALRQRQQDIIPLAHHFMLRFAAKEQLRDASITAAAEALLCTYAWPGNVRELENTLYRTMVIHHGQLTEANLKIWLTDKHEHAHEANTPRFASLSLLDEAGLVKPMEVIEREAMAYALAHFHGNITRASQALGIAKSTFYRKYGQASLPH